ncbi:ABC transporter ATP-binding protein [Ponticoccus sp. SC2-23]|uniref:ABC transporter ATP-binding protein n=1 Tax=Alexandriicola marinus TaxID=2081710 RepID=UPI000FD8BB72|nr:ABC transporter ATP-binding protein [Alexandriicola marinus]MBM1220953.1 ABC transporter ATP-binding protein [Ponticoccus sp. SC6-9]MBM1225523.1 ABC transporter ATP-binding protein [Ponticoccus sp. SC6-15]MBM1227706.1 ABC transporter ATP-binding protein [Ponticoccus sp. SC6-38]MBM1234656.1 ABC transporter ATP-binding protein [Ponticoccus sp. SC6-45]MBM1238208.1 ABC transporter ATP-binding protein [Ponticoccus sp. SC6-49]MBM1244159.1 ABC transporter ATP-binding protein [Ponticoccus sp. SC2-
MAQDTIITLRGVTNRFGDHVVHENLDLDVHRGEILGVVGGSGAGKSVLLRTITGLQRPASGHVRVFDNDVYEAGDEDRAAIEARWGVMFQDGALFSSLTVRENVEVPMKAVAGLDPEIAHALADLKIAMVGLPRSAGDKFPSELSGGMRKRAGLARSLALDPEIVFLDEPTAGLDPIGAADFDALIRGLSQSLGLTVFLVTHDLDTLHAVCDRIAVLAERRVLVSGTMDDMLCVDHPWVRSYFHGPRARAALHASEEPH